MAKAQAAIEFLTTYAWAILVVLIAIGALVAAGVLNPNRFLPKSCILMPGLSCTDFVANAAGVGITVLNGYGSRFESFSITIQNPGNACDGEVLTAVDGLGVAEIEVLTANCAIPPLVGDRFTADLTVTYQIAGQLPHSAIGSFATVVEGSESSAADQQICQNAESAGFCPGLDIVFGSGYQAACCSEYVLCCG